MGVGVLEWDPTPANDEPSCPANKPRVLEAYVVATSKSHRAERVVQDDVRRMQELWLNLRQSVTEHNPDVFGVEAYTVYKPTQGGHAGKGAGWKALYAYAMTCAIAFEVDRPIYSFRPADMKRALAANVSASKVDVEQALYLQVTGLEEALAGLPTNVHEHAADAVAHALLALRTHVGQLASAA